MKPLLTVDTGHLPPLGSARISARGDSYHAAFLHFQALLGEKAIPVVAPIFDDAMIDDIEEMAPTLRRRHKNVLIIGIGGSTLGFRAIFQAFRGLYANVFPTPHPKTFVVDNVDPQVTGELLSRLDLKNTLIIYISKSGSTPEPAANFLVFLDAYRGTGGDPSDIIIICEQTDNGINRIGVSLGARILAIPPDLSGRFSALSYVGLLPASLAGIDVRRLIQGARHAHAQTLHLRAQENPVFTLGSLLHANLTKERNIHFIFSYSNLLSEFNLWLIQLWSESLAKKLDLSGRTVNAGSTLVAGVGATDQHSILQLLKEGPRDKVVGFIRICDVADPLTIPAAFPEVIEYSYFGGHTLAHQIAIEQYSTEIALCRTGVPCYSLSLDQLDPTAFGCLLYYWELLVIFYAQLENVNPFNQPGVEEGKAMTYALMGRKDYANFRPDHEKSLTEHRSRDEFSCFRRQ